MTKSLTAQRNSFFLPSGFEPQEQINILEATGENKKRRDEIKERKRGEKKLLNKARICNKHKKRKVLPYIRNGYKHFMECPKKSTKTDQIQRGFDLATKWGWDGINRPYTPKIMSVFGGNKRKKGQT